ncbi:hypothetical protein VULLAG_LOCUS7527 [Vulpes lagopus]
MRAALDSSPDRRAGRERLRAVWEEGREGACERRRGGGGGGGGGGRAGGRGRAGAGEPGRRSHGGLGGTHAAGCAHREPAEKPRGGRRPPRPLRSGAFSDRGSAQGCLQVITGRSRLRPQRCLLPVTAQTRQTVPAEEPP